MSGSSYYVVVKGQVRGPVPAAALIRAGLQPETSVLPVGRSAWVPAGELDELRDLMGQAATPASPTSGDSPPQGSNDHEELRLELAPLAPRDVSPLLSPIGAAKPQRTRDPRLPPLPSPEEFYSESALEGLRTVFMSTVLVALAFGCIALFLLVGLGTMISPLLVFIGYGSAVVAGLAAGPATGLGLLSTYVCWALVQDGSVRIRPTKAVALLFVPVFNLYWIFPVYWGLAFHLNRVADRYVPQGDRVSERFAIATCVMLILGLIPYVGFVLMPVALLMLALHLSFCMDAASGIAAKLDFRAGEREELPWWRLWGAAPTHGTVP